MSNNEYTQNQLVASIWKSPNELGLINCKSAQENEFSMLVFEVQVQEEEISFQNHLVSLEEKQERYSIKFSKTGQKNENAEDLYSLSYLSLMGVEQDPPSITKSDMDSILESFVYMFNNTSKKERLVVGFRKP